MGQAVQTPGEATIQTPPALPTTLFITSEFPILSLSQAHDAFLSITLMFMYSLRGIVHLTHIKRNNEFGSVLRRRQMLGVKNLIPSLSSDLCCG